MATLAADKSRKFGISEGPHSNQAVIASDIIYQGAAVGDDGNGNARPLVGLDVFVGFAFAKADNAAGAAGDIDVELRTRGEVTLTVVGVASVADQQELVYATDDDTFTLTASGASSIGKVLRWITGTTCVVQFEAGGLRSI